MLRLPTCGGPACWLAAAWLTLAGGAAGAGEAAPAFAKKPTASRDGDKVKIEFAVDRETDVAVFVEDGRGKVVRHLAAGRLGRNAPAPLKAGSLEQSIGWDGKADYGRPAGAGPFTVRVGLGTRPQLQEIIGQDPASPGYVRSLAVGPGGELFVIHVSGQTHPDDHGGSIAVFNREGKYLRTIMPYPADLPDDKLKGLKRVELPDGKKVPFIYQIETRSYLPGLGNLPRERGLVTRDGRLAFVGILEGPRPFANPGEARLVTIGTDGSVPAHPLGPRVAWSSDSGANLALSPDEKTIYAAGLRTATHRSEPGPATICEKCDGEGHGNTWHCSTPAHAVYRFGWSDEKAAVFVGDPEKSGDGPDQMKTPIGVATDAEGNVYVADRGNDRIAVFSPDGKPLTQWKVPAPLQVEVHRKTGAVYVLAGRGSEEKPQDVELIKFDGRKSAKEVCRIVAGRMTFWATRTPLLALDESADPPILYASPLVRIEDRGEEFSEPVSLLTASGKGSPGSIGAVMELSLDRTRDWLYVNSYWRYRVGEKSWDCIAKPKGARGWTTMWPAHSTFCSTGSVGLDGNFYSFIGMHGGRVYRFSPEMTLIPFPKAEVRKSTEGDDGRPVVGTGYGHGNGHTADVDGNLYVIWNKGKRDPGDYHQAQALSVYGPDGAVKREKLIDSCTPNIFSLRVDQAGSIYVALGLRPGKETLPPGLEGRVAAGAEEPEAVNKLNGYPLIYGSIAKFPPTGGRIGEKIGGAACNFGTGRPIEVQGAEWIFPGASTVTSWATPKKAPGTVTMCLCEAACFDVDEFGRSFFADAGRCRVGMVDSAGNEIGWFGSYGNQDAPKAEIALAWPQAVAVGNGSVYVGDRVNRRVLRIRLNQQVAETCPIK